MSSDNSISKQSPMKGLYIQEERTDKEINLRRIKAKDVARKLKSFDHFIYVWGEKGGYYLPPKGTLTWHYVSQILAKEKRLLRLEQVGHQLEVPKIRGSVVNEMFNRERDHNGLQYYFPDFSETQNVPRDYFFNVSFTRF